MGPDKKKQDGMDMERKEKFIADLRVELTDSEIVSGLGNGDLVS